MKPCRDDKGNIIGYEIYNYFGLPKYANIIIRDDGVTWCENPYTECKDFTKEQMYSLYEKILEYYHQKGSDGNEKTIKEET